MKRLKKLLPALIALLLAFVMAFAVACSGSCSSCGGNEEPGGEEPGGEEPGDDSVEGPGLKVSLATDTPDTIELSSTQTTASIDLTKIVVEVVSETGETLETLTDADYNVELYKGSEKLTQTTGLGGGVYQIWATTKNPYKLESTWNPSNFVLVYVVNNLVSLAWDSSAQDTVTEQESNSTDSISSTWKFTATYANGETKDVSEDVVLTGLDTKVAGENKTATATYTEANAKGEEKSATAEVTYTITQPAGAVTTESFLVPDEAVPTESATITAESNIEDNSLFTIKASGDMIYSIGKSDTDGVPNPNKLVKATLLDGTEKVFKQGLKQKDAVAPDGTTETKTITITAKSNISVRVYIGMANDNFNSDRAGTIKYTVSGGEAQTTKVAKREQIATIEVTLTAGQTLTLVGVLDSQTDTSKTGKLWLFGVEAKGQASSAPAGTSESFLVPDTEVAEAEATIDKDTKIVDNTLFAVASGNGVVYSVGDKSLSNGAVKGVPNPSKEVKATLLDGTEKVFKQGLKQADAVTPDGSTETQAITITAKANITVRVYIGIANDKFNSDRAGTIKYTVSGREAQTSTISKREQIATIEVTLTEGQTLTLVGVLDSQTDTSKTGKLWLFGVEAKTN